MITLPTEQKEIDKERNIEVLVVNRLGIETITDLYTAKRMVLSGDVEIVEENTKKTTKKSEKTEEETK